MFVKTDIFVLSHGLIKKSLGNKFYGQPGMVGITILFP